MNTYSMVKLQKILEKHKLWLQADPNGVRANLSEVTLSEVTLSEVTLSGANLSRAGLYKANLSETNLEWAALSEALLYGANLSGANLSGANLSGANLSGANLSGANLSGASLSGANLSGANLSGANLSGANLYEANLSGAKLPDYKFLPDTGNFVAWKKVSGNVILKLEIPEDAQRVCTPIGRKCRANKVTVEEVVEADDEDAAIEKVMETVSETYQFPNYYEVRTQTTPL